MACAGSRVGLVPDRPARLSAAVRADNMGRRIKPKTLGCFLGLANFSRDATGGTGMLNQEAQAGFDALQAELARDGVGLADVLQRLRLQDYHGYLVRLAGLCRQVCAASELVSID